MKIQSTSLNAYKTQKMQNSFKNVSDKIIRIKNKAAENFKNIDLKLFVGTINHRKILGATAFSTGLGGMAIWSLNQTPIDKPQTNLINFDVQKREVITEQNQSIGLSDTTFYTEAAVLSLRIVVTILVAGYFAFQKPKSKVIEQTVHAQQLPESLNLRSNQPQLILPQNVPPDNILFKTDHAQQPPNSLNLRFNLPQNVHPDNILFKRVSQIQVLLIMLKDIEWHKRTRNQDRWKSAQKINESLKRLTLINKTLLNLSDVAFKVWEENLIKLLASINYEKDHEYRNFAMNEAYIQFFKRQYEEKLEIKFDGTEHEGSTLLKTQELCEQKTSSEDPNFAEIKANVLKKMIHAESLFWKTITKKADPSQSSIIERIQKEKSNLIKDLYEHSKFEFSEIERRSLQFLSKLNYAKLFYFKRYSIEEWQGLDFANVEKLYIANVRHEIKCLKNSKSSLEKHAPIQKMYGEFYALIQYLNEINNRIIFLSPDNSGELILYQQKNAQLEELKSKINNIIYILNLSETDLYKLKVDLIKLDLSWNQKTGRFQENIKERRIEKFLQNLKRSAISYENRLYPPVQQSENVVLETAEKALSAQGTAVDSNNQDVINTNKQLPVLNEMLEIKIPNSDGTLSENESNKRESIQPSLGEPPLGLNLLKGIESKNN